MLTRIVAFAILLSAAAPPSRPESIAPVGNWNIEASETRCVAIRQYGDAAKPVTLMLTAAPKGNVIQLAVVREGYMKGADQAGATIVAGDSSFETSALRYPTRTGKKRKVALLNLSEDASTAVRGASEVSVNIGGSADATFPLGDTASMWAQMDKCLDHLRDVWNIGDAYESRIAQGARGNIQPMFRPEDYPRDALMSGGMGTTRFLLLIDEEGRVSDCMLLETSGMAILDSRSCGIVVERGRFIPAVGTDGKPTKTADERRVSWRLK
jgi:hypothetical protein